MSMEQTTTGVVKGARLAQDAGIALEEIEGVLSSLAELIQSISHAARQQVSSAGHISNKMNVVQEITSQTSSGTSVTAQSIGNLVDMVTDLQDSVAGFTLPEGIRMAFANEDDVVFDGGDDQDVELNLDASQLVNSCVVSCRCK